MPQDFIILNFFIISSYHTSGFFITLQKFYGILTFPTTIANTSDTLFTAFFLVKYFIDFYSLHNSLRSLLNLLTAKDILLSSPTILFSNFPVLITTLSQPKFFTLSSNKISLFQSSFTSLLAFSSFSLFFYTIVTNQSHILFALIKYF